MSRFHPSIGVAIPSYNHSKYIAETLRSVFRQTLSPQEVYVIDDGSKDNSVEIIEKIFKESGSINCRLKVRENRGISATRNELIEGMDTEIVALLDSDDVYAPTRLERIIGAVSHQRPFFAISGVNFISELDNDETLSWKEFYREVLFMASHLPTAGFAFLRSNFAITASNFIFSRSLFDTVGKFDPQIFICQDWDYAIRATLFVEPTFIPEILISYRLHPNNTVRTLGQYIANENYLVFEKLDKFGVQETVNPKAPLPKNWPKFFKYFVTMCPTGMNQPLASLIPLELNMNNDAPSRFDEKEALHQLLSLWRNPTLYQNQSITNLLNKCNVAWSHSL